MTDVMIICTIFSVFFILSFTIGAKVGQKISKGEEIEIKLPNPVQKVSEYIEKKETEKEQNKLEIIAENIDNYDGTGIGQKDIPKK